MQPTLPKIHYTDIQSVTMLPAAMPVTTAVQLFFANTPLTVLRLFWIQNKLVGLLGYPIPGLEYRREKLQAFQCKVGEKLGIFTVYEVNNCCVRLGGNWPMLKFENIFTLEKNTLTATVETYVFYKNAWGRLYFWAVQPAHRWVVKRMLRAIKTS